jgi:ribonucleoside-diphosphate reductase alpha chain
VFNLELERTQNYLARIFSTIWTDGDIDTITNYHRYGRRNIAILTAAPTGSLSLLTQTTSGIEPVFKIAYKRRKKINPNDKNGRVDFVDDMGDKFEEFYVFHNHF